MLDGNVLEWVNALGSQMKVRDQSGETAGESISEAEKLDEQREKDILS